jgi:Bacterial SH3 domain
MRLCARIVLLASLALAPGCQNPTVRGWLHGPPPPPAPEPDPACSTEIDLDVVARAQSERTDYLEREVSRLRADLQQAEESIVELESGLRGPHTRADAVSAVAEARIALDRVSRGVPWRWDRVSEARTKLEEADRQLASDHLGSAVFFAARAQRITESLRAEAKRVSNWPARREIRGDRVNLRSEPTTESSVVDVLTGDTPLYPERATPEWTLVRTPDGRVGWVYQSLLK